MASTLISISRVRHPPRSGDRRVVDASAAERPTVCSPWTWPATAPGTAGTRRRPQPLCASPVAAAGVYPPSASGAIAISLDTFRTARPVRRAERMLKLLSVDAHDALEDAKAQGRRPHAWWPATKIFSGARRGDLHPRPSSRGCGHHAARVCSVAIAWPRVCGARCGGAAVAVRAVPVPGAGRWSVVAGDGWCSSWWW